MKEEVNMLLEPARVFLLQVGEFLPKLVLAVLVLIAGWLLAKLARFTLDKGLRALNFNVLGERSGIDGFLQQGGVGTDLTGILVGLVYWLVILMALIIGFNSLGLTYITELLGQVAWFVPKVVAAVLILAFGAYFARFISNTVVAYCRKMEIPDAEPLGRIAQYTIIVFVVLIALDQVEVGGEIVRASFLIILAGVVFALALAFGLGGRNWAEGMLERWWPRARRGDED